MSNTKFDKISEGEKDYAENNHIILEKEFPNYREYYREIKENKRLDQLSVNSNPCNPKEKEIKDDRITCLDVFRGITLFYMVVVNSSLDDNIYWFLTESEWNGLTPGDCIFPTFLFIMGISLVLSKSKKGDTTCILFLRILKRSSILFTLGFFFNLQKVNFSDLKNLRIMGVLQRLGLTYFFVSSANLFFEEFYFFKSSRKSSFDQFKNRTFFYKNFGFPIQVVILLIFIIIYSGFAYKFNVPNCGIGKIEPICFSGSYIDRIIFGNSHIWVQNQYDPEGIISTFSAIYPVFIGYFYGKIINYIKNKKKAIFDKTIFNDSEKLTNLDKNGNKEFFMERNEFIHKHEITIIKNMIFYDKQLLFLWFVFSISNLSLGFFCRYILNVEFNKKAYTLSFMFLVCGISGIGLCLFYCLLDLIKNIKFKKYFSNYFFEPFKWMGMNSLLVFCGSTFYFIVLDSNIKFFSEEYRQNVSIYRLMHDKIFFSIIPNNQKLAEFLFSLFAGILFMLISFICYKKSWFLKL